MVDDIRRGWKDDDEFGSGIASRVAYRAGDIRWQMSLPFPYLDISSGFDLVLGTVSADVEVVSSSSIPSKAIAKKVRMDLHGMQLTRSM